MRGEDEQPNKERRPAKPARARWPAYVALPLWSNMLLSPPLAALYLISMLL